MVRVWCVDKIRPKKGLTDSLVIHISDSEIGNTGWILVNGKYLCNQEVESLESALGEVVAVMEHSFGDGWRNPDFLSVDYGANDSVDGMQDMAKVLRDYMLSSSKQSESVSP